MIANNGGPAFPTKIGSVPGMTLRDYFAAKAMQGMLAACRDQAMFSQEEELAELAYGTADAMLKERDKP